MTNGHTGEVFALSPRERAQVTRTVAEAVNGKLPVISGVCAEGMNEAAEHAVMAREAGASGLLVMPPHYWLRFGMEPEHVIDHFTAIGKAAQINLVIHVYPAWTKASYSSSSAGGAGEVAVRNHGQDRNAGDVQVRSGSGGDSRVQSRLHYPHLSRRIPAGDDGAGSRWRAGRLCLVYSGAGHLALRRRSGE